MTSPVPSGSGRHAGARAVEGGGGGVVVGRIEPAPSLAPPDEVLLGRLREDDAAALDVLLERHWAAVFAYGLRRTGSRDLAADLAQDVLVRLWERRLRWRPGGSVRGLLLRLARNTAVSQHRRTRARDRASSGFAELYLRRGPTALPAERAELRSALEHAIDALPPRRREVFHLRMIEDLSYDEIAGVMGTSRQTVANQLSHALAALRRMLAHLLD